MKRVLANFLTLSTKQSTIRIGALDKEMVYLLFWNPNTDYGIMEALGHYMDYRNI
jgi:hypothetical protein